MDSRPGLSESPRHLLAAWWILALLALGLATVMALVLVAARTPFLGLGGGFFRTALVLHVNFAVVVWFLAWAAGAWMAAAPVAGRPAVALAWSGVGLAAGGAALALGAAAWGQGTPILANYVPIIDSPVFLWGLGSFAAGVLLAALAALAGGPRGSIPAAGPPEWRWAAGMALVSFLAAVVVLGTGLFGEGPYEDRVWGAGHVLQAVHTLMLMAAWLLLGESALARLGRGRRAVGAAVCLGLLVPVADLWLAFSLPFGSDAYRRGFTDVMRWASWPAPMLLAALIAVGLRRKAGEERLGAGDWGVLASMGLFLFGAVVGAGIRGDNASVPAHYHGTVGAVTLAYMLWGRSWAPRLGLQVPAGVWWHRQPFIYALGIGLLVAGLAWSGWLGVPRKAPHAEILAAGSGYWAAMGIAGIGGFLATLGAGIFVVCLFKAIWRKGVNACKAWGPKRTRTAGGAKSAGGCSSWLR